jgi:hypothetical protein
MLIFVDVEATEAGFKMAVFFPFKDIQGWRVYSVSTPEEFRVPEIHGGRLRDFSEGRLFRRWLRARSSVCSRKADASVNRISRKQQPVRACIGGVNGPAREADFQVQVVAENLRHLPRCCFWSSRGALHHRQKQQGPTTTETCYVISLSQARAESSRGRVLC